MKKLTFFLALTMIVSLSYAQRGYNGPRNGHHAGNGYHTQDYRGHRGDVGFNNGARNQRHYNSRNYRTTTTVRGGVYSRHDNWNRHNNWNNNNWNRGQQRVRWEISNCGRFEYRIVERMVCTPGRWVYRRGCRTWIQPTNAWNCASRTRYNRGCSRL